MRQKPNDAKAGKADSGVRRPIVMTAAALLAVLYGGGPPAAAQDPETGAPRFALEVLSPRAEQWFVFSPPMFSATGPLPRVEFNVQNISRSDRMLEYRVDWTDRSGMSLPGNVAWQTIVLAPGQSTTVRAVAITTDAYRARVSVQSVEGARQ